MNVKRRLSRSLVVPVGIAVLVLAMAAGSAGALARRGGHAATAKCTAAQLEVWLGLGEGGGTLGSVFYPLEFSNTSRHACTLNGFPGVSAIGSGGHQIGPAASRNGQHHGTVTLSPGRTAHVILRIVDAGALCSSSVTAVALKVFPPGATGSDFVPFSFQACAHRGVLVVGPVHSGVGIPGFTIS
jgi:Domain of unknown function (DUF4232)